MLTYKDLSASQRKCIDTFIQYYPEMKTATEITSKQIRSMCQEIYKKRSSGAPVIAFPNWLAKHNQLRRGVHAFPSPLGNKTEKQILTDEKKSLEKLIDTLEPQNKDDSDKQFLAELRANGITV